MFSILRYGPLLGPCISLAVLHADVRRQACLVASLAVMWSVEKATKRALAGDPRFTRPAACMHKIFTDAVSTGSCGFPSGHTAHAALCALIVVARWRCMVYVAAALVVVSAAERVRTGCHTPVQCAAGAALGAAAFAVFLHLSRLTGGGCPLSGTPPTTQC